MNVLRSGGGGAVAETDLIRDLRSRGYLPSSEIRRIQGPNMVNMFDVDSHMSVDRQQDGDNENMQSNRGSDEDGDEDRNGYGNNNPNKDDDEIDKIQNNVDSERASYAYLLDMPIRSLTDVKGNALLRDAEMAKLKLESLQAKSENDLWLADLDILSTACDQLYSNKN